MKKVAVLTLPLNANYGGILQAFALLRVLHSLGYKAELIVHTFLYVHRKWYGQKTLKKILPFLCRVLLGKPTYSEHIPIFFAEYTFKSFVEQYMSYSECLTSKNLQKIITEYDRWIVGSDQVWRYGFTGQRCAFLYFLGLLPEEQRKRSLSYAASFGLGLWEGPPEQTAYCASLLHQFQAVSVREHSGVDICRNLFGVKAEQVPDPTLLLQRSDYDSIIDKSSRWRSSEEYIVSYILDESDRLSSLVSYIGKEMQLIVRILMPQHFGRKLRDRLPISVPLWLQYIRDSKYLITDSFHGCVFAIIFHIPFVCLGNEERGTVRFESLLKTFKLEDRMISTCDTEEVQAILKTPIDWEKIETIHKQERERGLNFLKSNLES